MKQQAIDKLYKECSEIITEETQEIHQLILGEGNLDSDIIFLVDAPGVKEEESGEAISGRSKDKLHHFFEQLGLEAKDVYITNMVKYRPYRVNANTGRILNRSLKKDEINFFVPYLKKEIEIIQPKILVTLGMNVLKGLLEESVDLKDVHGKQRFLNIEDKDYIVFPMYHPLAMAYSSEDLNGDLQNLKRLISKVSNMSEEDLRVFNLEEKKEEEKKTVIDEGPTYKIFDVIEEKEVKKYSSEPREVVETIKSYGVSSKYSTKEKKEASYDDRISKNGESSLTSFVDRSLRNKESYRSYSKSSNGSSEFKNGAKMRTLLVYAGGTEIDDPTYVVVDRISSVLTELNGSIIRYDLNRKDVDIQDFFVELENANGVILATTIEWIGIGGLLQQFLDECWRFANKEFFKEVFLMSVAISKQGYERDGYNHLIKSWELLGGLEGVSVLASMQSSVELDTNFQLLHTIEKKAEEFYRVTTSNKQPLPTSIRMNRNLIDVPQVVSFVPQEDNFMPDNMSGESSKRKEIGNYDEFIERQQQDIEDISNIFKKKLEKRTVNDSKTIPEIIREKFRENEENIACKIQWEISDNKNKNFIIDIRGKLIKSQYGQAQEPTMHLTSEQDVLSKVINGTMTLQRAFMTGKLKVKGDFSLVYKLDKMFEF